MADRQVIVVTGSNRGVGKGIVQLLASHQFERPLTIYAASRSGLDGGVAVLAPNKVLYRKLDITSQPSIRSFFDSAVQEQGSIDILINNAAICHDHHETPDLAAETVWTNYGGARNMCEAFLTQPTLRPRSRIVNVTSGYNHLSTYGTSLRKAFRDANDIDALDKLAAAYLVSVRCGPDKQEVDGWGCGARSYKVSKALVNTLTVVLARRHEGVLVNCCCPGHVDTEMGNMARTKPPKTPEEGARVPTRLAVGDLGPGGDEDGGLGKESDGVTGHFFENENIVVPGWGKAKLWLES
jgi:carbonyl reductase 1